MKNKGTAKLQKGAKILIWYLFCLMFFFAISSTMVGIIVSDMSKDYSLSYSQIGMLVSIQSVGSLAATFFGGAFSDRFGKWKLIGINFAGFTVVLCLVGFVPPYSLLIVYFLLMGLTSGFLSLLISACIPEIVGEQVEFYMNMSHAFFGLGSLVGPLYSLAAMGRGLRWNTVFLVLGLICAAILALYFLVARLRTEDNAGSEKPEAVQEAKGLGEILTDGRLLWISFVCFLYMGQQSVVNLWIAPYTQEKLLADTSGIALSIYWAGVMGGRFLSSFAGRKVDSKKLLCMGCLVSAAVWAVVLPMGNFEALEVCLCINGLLTGAAFPVCISAACICQPQRTGTATSVVCLAGSAGGSVLTWLAGVIIEKSSYLTGLAMIPAVLFACGICLFWSGFRRRKALPNAGRHI